MSLIVVMEDDDTLRLFVSSILKKHGHTVFQAANGALGLALVRLHRPDLVVSDVQMPELDGVAMLTELRNDTSIAATPVILLTSLSERNHVRTGMNSGADDYLTKPFQPDELREAVDAQLNRQAVQIELQTQAVGTAVKTALDSQRHSLATVYERRLQKELSGERWPGDSDMQTDEQHPHATVLYVELISAGLSAVLNTTELAEVLKRAYTSASDNVHLFGARHVHMVGEGLLAVFVPENDTASVTHGVRACRSAMGVLRTMQQQRKVLEQKFSKRALPAFELGVAIHAGPVAIVRMSDPLHGGAMLVLPVGDTINVTLQMQKKYAPVGWPVVCSDVVLAHVEGIAALGRSEQFRSQVGAQPMQVTELKQLVSAVGANAASASR